MNWEAFIHYAEQLALGGVASFLVFVALLPTKFGQKLLDHHFEAKIAGLKRDQEAELARLRSDLDHLKDRGIRSNEREYQAITAAWESFVEAFLATRIA